MAVTPSGEGGYGPAGQRPCPARVGGYGRGARSVILPYLTSQKRRTQGLIGFVERPEKPLLRNISGPRTPF